MTLTLNSFIREQNGSGPFYVLLKSKNEDTLVEIEIKDFNKCELLDKTRSIIPTVKLRNSNVI